MSKCNVFCAVLNAFFSENTVLKLWCSKVAKSAILRSAASRSVPLRSKRVSSNYEVDQTALHDQWRGSLGSCGRPSDSTVGNPSGFCHSSAQSRLRRDILSRKDVAALATPGTCRTSRAMQAMWDHGIVPSDGSFACLTDPHSGAHCNFTRIRSRKWLKLFSDTTDQILVDLKKLKDNERKHAESQSRTDAILHMYKGKGRTSPLLTRV